MLSIRRLELAADSLYKEKKIRGFLHLYIGQEAIAVGMNAVLSPEDAIITAYRCHGFAYLRGSTPREILAELMGKSTGSSSGKGGSMHLFSRGFFGGNGIVGAQVPVGAGIAFAQKYREQGAATFACYGDGAANQGQVFEAYNMAALWKLPCVFVCENNRYGMGTSAERSSASTAYYSRGDYLPGVKVDGMNILAVREACRFARQYALENGPIVLEMDTYRYQGHSMSDPGTTYRTRDEIRTIRQDRDCIEYASRLLRESSVASEQELASIESQVKGSIEESVRQAISDPLPKPDALFTDIYAPPLK